MLKAARTIQLPDSKNHQTPAKSAGRKKIPVTIPRTTIQITHLTKTILEQVKAMEHLETYDDAINFLFRERRNCLPSSFGCMPDSGPFEREDEDDPYRLPS
ncbi:MAG: hypothetical protein Q8N94_08735 [Methanoregula sp.]|nr:hypothetical protein [Methanoregula sp.]